jgi:transketolase C-terminal domain/subunit
VPIEHNNVINDLPLPAFGEGSIIQEGSNAIVFVASPLLAIEVLKATAILSADNLKITVVVMPWLNALSIKWVKPLVEKFNHVFIVENHDYTNSFGTFLTYQISTNNIAGERNFYHKAVKGIPACGKVDEVLAFHKLNAESLADDFRSKLTSKHD